MSDPCDHAYDIANLIALHDFPGMPDIVELEPDIREAYLNRAVEVLSLTPQGDTDKMDGSTNVITAAEVQGIPQCTPQGDTKQ